ncbi:MAG: alpha-glucan family phosphorylase [Chloroflexia bacterium]
MTTNQTTLPQSFSRLTDLAYNLRWVWNDEAKEAFRRVGGEEWDRSGRNPVLMLKSLDPLRLQEAALDPELVELVERAADDLDAYMSSQSTWYQSATHHDESFRIAYFSAEFGLTETLPVYSGGLGVLAGDHLKSASDLGVPLTGVGLLYQHGYFRQHLDFDGYQREHYDTLAFEDLPLVLERNADDSPLTVEIDFPGRTVWARVWRAQVGRVSLYMLDTNIAANEVADQDITDHLYGGDNETRIQQELVLGIGGYRALKALGINPTVCHMNEGHSAFLAMERARTVMQESGVTFLEAHNFAKASTVFTTHTPVEAGHDYFSPDLMDRYFSTYYQELGVSRTDFLALGRKYPWDDSEYYCMTVAALKSAQYSNGVSELHGEISREMWQMLWPHLPANETPITHITNGVHLASWVSPEMCELYDRYLGDRWLTSAGADTRQKDGIPEWELWFTHQGRREKLVEFARGRLVDQLVRRTAPEDQIQEARGLLKPDALTIGFARRFATYKRATLFLRDSERLARILNNPDRPVQMIFAGKAHPRDEGGKLFAKHIIEMSRQPEFLGKIVFVEDYDIEVGRYLVQGSDVWLNNPRRPMEASGTSGMKAAANGALNLSTLDGWWAEAWSETDIGADPIGWAIGNGSTFDDQDYQEQIEAEALYELLENEVVPSFYERTRTACPTDGPCG